MLQLALYNWACCKKNITHRTLCTIQSGISWAWAPARYKIQSRRDAPTVLKFHPRRWSRRLLPVVLDSARASTPAALVRPGAPRSPSLSLSSCSRRRFYNACACRRNRTGSSPICKEQENRACACRKNVHGINFVFDFELISLVLFDLFLMRICEKRCFGVIL
jgi:hypothetical protein